MGTWTTEATHPALPGVMVRGSADIAWLEGRRFLTLRPRNDYPDIADSLAVIGDMEKDRVGGDDAGTHPGSANAPRLRMHYFDSRGVFRAYEVSVNDTA